MSLGEALDAVRFKHFRDAHNGLAILVVGCEFCEGIERIQIAYEEMMRLEFPVADSPEYVSVLQRDEDFKAHSIVETA